MFTWLGVATLALVSPATGVVDVILVVSDSDGSPATGVVVIGARDCVLKSTAVFCGTVELAFTGLGVVTLVLEAMNVAFTIDADGFSADVAKINNAKYAPTFDECIPYNTIRI